MRRLMDWLRKGCSSSIQHMTYTSNLTSRLAGDIVYAAEILPRHPTMTTQTGIRWLHAAALGALLVTTPFWARAGVLGAVGGFAKEKAVDLVKDKAGEFAKERLGSKESTAPVALPGGGTFAECAELFPGGVPIDIKAVHSQWKPRALCSGSYAVVYSGLSKTPLIVVERLSRAQLADALDEQRTNEFYADPRVPRAERAELSDYAGTGYDRGHIAPAGDMPDQTAMAQSFALSNIVPQDPVNNRKGGAWFKVESDTRKFARRAEGYVYVFSGPLFDGKAKTVGKNAVWVPTRLFKMVYDEASGRSWAHLIPNTAEAQPGKPVDYATFVKETGWRTLPPKH